MRIIDFSIIPVERAIRLVLFLLMGVLVIGCMACAPPASPTYYVATNGNDQWSGKLAARNGAGTDGPFATLLRARDEARKSRRRPVHIVVEPGSYYLAETLALGPQDSGLVIEGDKNQNVVVSGGRLVKDWKPWKGEILQADLSKLALPDLNFHELYYNGRLTPWTRCPNFDPQHPRTGGFLQNAGIAEAKTKTKFMYKEGQLHPETWAHPERAWIVFHDSLNYETQYCPLKSIDTAKRILEAAQGVYVLSKGDPYYVCGLLEELDAPGEWAVDPDTKTLYFWPPSGNPNETDQVVVPALTSAFLLKGDAAQEKWVENVSLAGLAVRDCRGRAIELSGARGCTVAACDLRNAEVGVFLGDNTHACKVVGCDITDTQGDGVSILGTNPDYEHVSDHVVDNNYIWNIGWGRIHNRCGGVYMHRCMRCKVTHNHIHDTPRYAIGMDVGGDCEIAYNYCHHSNEVTLDTSIIEAATAMDWDLPMDEQKQRNHKWNWGNSVHHNIMHDSGGWGTDAQGHLSAPRFSWGLYFDTYSSGWHVYDNLIYNTVLGAYMVNGGVDNIFENNICLDGKDSQTFLETWPKYEMFGDIVQHNIFTYQGKTADVYHVNRFTMANATYRENLIWSADGKVSVGVGGGLVGLHKKSWKAWLEEGEDEGSVIADPQFVDARKPSWQLKPTSPAFKLGFKPIDLSQVGNYASPERRTWPRPEVKVVRDVLDYTPHATLANQR
jgi:hypothetical protein